MSIKAHILVVDDETDILELIKYNLTKEKYTVTCLTTGEEAIRVFRNELPDLMILDLMLPGMDGLEVCKILKNDERTLNVPIIMLSAKGDESDIVVGLELGADDYITKPFSPKILLARIKAVLQRSRKSTPSDEESPLRIAGLSIFPERHEVTLDGEQVNLTVTEFRILHFLARRPGWVFTRYQIVDAVRGEHYPVTERSVDVHIVSLRKKLGDFGVAIETVWGVGYRFHNTQD
ncbi:MAG: response regulator [bacterium]|nr:response regulator [bacterium]